MGEKFVEKTHRINSVLLNDLRRKPAAASGLQQAETGCVMEQELCQSQHASILEPNATAQQSFSSIQAKSVQLNTSRRRARMTGDAVARLGICALISVLCERDVPEIDWEKLVKTGRESEVRRMLEFEMYDEVSEELTSGKRILNSASLDSQKKSGVARSALAANQVRGACKCEDVFAGERKIVRKDETTWKLLKAGHGTQVASLRRQRLARGILCKDRWKVPTSVPCVGYLGDVTTILSTTVGALMHGGHWLVMRSMMQEVRDVSSCKSEFHGKESGAVRESLMNYICRKDREQTKTLAVHCDAVARRMVQRLGARKHCNFEVKWLWLRQALDKIELWNDVMWIL